MGEWRSGHGLQMDSRVTEAEEGFRRMLITNNNVTKVITTIEVSTYMYPVLNGPVYMFVKLYRPSLLAEYSTQLGTIFTSYTNTHWCAGGTLPHAQEQV
jgi:hypothetical protein